MASAATRPSRWPAAHDPDCRTPLDYLIAFALLLLAAMLPVLIAAESAFQSQPGELHHRRDCGPIGDFAVVGLLAIWIIVSLLCGILDGQQA